MKVLTAHDGNRQGKPIVLLQIEMAGRETVHIYILANNKNVWKRDNSSLKLPNEAHTRWFKLANRCQRM